MYDSEGNTFLEGKTILFYFSVSSEMVAETWFAVY